MTGAIFWASKGLVGAAISTTTKQDMITLDAHGERYQFVNKTARSREVSRPPSPNLSSVDGSLVSCGSSDSNASLSDLSLARVTVSRRLYISHLLSTLNSRVFEFGAVLFIARVFPGTLLPISIYALTRAGSAVSLSAAVGSYIDENERLKVVRLSIGRPNSILSR